MSIEIKFFLFQIVIILPFLTGTLIKDKIKNPENTAKKLVEKNLIFLEPGIVFWSIWGLALTREMIILPAAGIFLVLAGFAVGRITLPLLKLKGMSKPTYLVSSSLANHGFTMGGIICYLLMGERGLGLAAIFISYFMFYTYLVIFTYAGQASGSGAKLFSLKNMKQLFINFRNMPLYAAFSGLAVNLCGITRPDIWFPFDYMLMVSVALYYFTLGINFYFKSLYPLGREHLALAASKFLIIPLLAAAVLWLTDVSPETKSVIIIQSFMPVAIYSVITSVLFKLDTKLASSLFFVNTLIFIVFVLPVMFMIYSGIF